MKVASGRWLATICSLLIHILHGGNVKVEGLPLREVHNLEEQVTRYLYAMGHNILMAMDQDNSYDKYLLYQARDELGKLFLSVH